MNRDSEQSSSAHQGGTTEHLAALAKATALCIGTLPATPEQCVTLTRALQAMNDLANSQRQDITKLSTELRRTQDAASQLQKANTLLQGRVQERDLAVSNALQIIQDLQGYLSRQSTARLEAEVGDLRAKLEKCQKLMKETAAHVMADYRSLLFHATGLIQEAGVGSPLPPPPLPTLPQRVQAALNVPPMAQTAAAPASFLWPTSSPVPIRKGKHVTVVLPTPRKSTGATSVPPPLLPSPSQTQTQTPPPPAASAAPVQQLMDKTNGTTPRPLESQGGAEPYSLLSDAQMLLDLMGSAPVPVSTHPDATPAPTTAPAPALAQTSAAPITPIAVTNSTAAASSSAEIQTSTQLPPPSYRELMRLCDRLPDGPLGLYPRRTMQETREHVKTSAKSKRTCKKMPSETPKTKQQVSAAILHAMEQNATGRTK